MPTQRLPLFPLRTVLFPGMGLPLHVFEERYRLMLRECLESDRRFGVCLIRHGEEVGEPAEPYAIGTEAEILSARKLPDGRMDLMVVGRRRFRVATILQWRPYIAGDVGLLPEDDDAAERTVELARETRAALVAYVQQTLELSDRGFTPLSLPRDPVGLSYAAAALLRIAPQQKQSLLEEDSVAARLEQTLDHLREGLAELQSLLQIRRAHSCSDAEGADDGSARWN
jgi:Lon protease-like protein